MPRKYKRYNDRKAGNKKLKVSGKALILLPTKTTKLCMGWKGPYEAVEKLSRLDYRIKAGRKVKTFCINMLKQYIERENDEQFDQLNDTSQVCAISVIEMASEESNDEVIEELIETLSHGNTQDNSQVNINQNLSTEEKEQVLSLVQEFSETFSDKPRRTTLLDHDIKLTTDTPVRVKQYPLPFSMLETVGDEIRSMIELGVVEH